MFSILYSPLPLWGFITQGPLALGIFILTPPQILVKHFFNFFEKIFQKPANHCAATGSALLKFEDFLKAATPRAFA